MNKKQKILVILRNLGIVGISISTLLFFGSISFGMINLGLDTLLFGLPAGAIAVATQYILETNNVIKKNTKPSYNDIPEEMKVNDSDNTNENFEMKKIYVTEYQKLGFSSNTLEKQNNSNIHNEDFSKNRN